jgi:hypothetical protein
VEKDQRLWVWVDWSKAPKGTASGTVKITQDSTTVSVKVNAVSAADVTRDTLRGFVEDDGIVSIEPEHFTHKTDQGDLKWIRVEDYGRTLSAMRGQGPVDFPAITPGAGTPSLEYQAYFFTAGGATIYNVLAPNLPFIPGRDMRFAVSIDDQAPVMVIGIPKTHAATVGDWTNNAKDEARIVSMRLQIPSTGYHTLKIWMVDPGITLQKLIVDMGTMKASYLGPPESYHKIP